MAVINTTDAPVPSSVPTTATPPSPATPTLPPRPPAAQVSIAPVSAQSSLPSEKLPVNISIPQPPFSHSWAVVKNLFAFFLLNVDTALIIISVYGFSIHKGNMGLVDAAFFYGFGLAAGALSLLFIVADALCLMTRGIRGQISPGGHVAVHLIISLITAVLSALETVVWIYNDDYSSIDYESEAEYFQLYSIALRHGWIYRVIAVLVYIAFLGHFVWFVRSCIETHRLRRFRKTVYAMPQVQPACVYAPVNLAGNQAMAVPYGYALVPTQKGIRWMQVPVSVPVPVQSMVVPGVPVQQQASMPPATVQSGSGPVVAGPLNLSRSEQV